MKLLSSKYIETATMDTKVNVFQLGPYEFEAHVLRRRGADTDWTLQHSTGPVRDDVVALSMVLRWHRNNPKEFRDELQS